MSKIDNFVYRGQLILIPVNIILGILGYYNQFTAIAGWVVALMYVICCFIKEDN